METKITKLEHSHVQIDVKVDEKVWKDAKDNAFKKIASNITVDGFRKGKAPVNLLKGKVDQVKVMDEAINAILPNLYKEVLTKENIKPYAQPKVDVTDISEKTITVRFVIVTAPEITLGKYKDHAIGKKEVKVSEKEINDALTAIQKENASVIVKKGESQRGDIVILDFKGTVDGRPFEGGSATNYELELGSGAFIPGFEDQLIGHKANQHVDVKVTFPKQYTPELAGKDAVFACDIHEVKEKKLPELTDDFVKDLGLKNINTLEELKKDKESSIKATKEKEFRQEYLHKLFDAIAKASKVDIPDEIVENQVDSMRKDIENRMSQNGLTIDQYLSLVGQKKEEFETKLKSDARRDVTNYMLLEKIGVSEGLKITEEDLEKEVVKISSQYNMKPEDVKKALSAQIEEFKNNLLMTKVEEFLIKSNK